MRMRSSLQKTSYSIECYLEVGLIQHENPLILRDRPILIAKISSFPRTLFEWYLCLSFMCFPLDFLSLPFQQILCMSKVQLKSNGFKSNNNFTTARKSGTMF